ncbi:MAG: hypothetical protein COB15_12335 [Flavobacteriales bacterium]|nr:MAG: hypothetical protein COB15_12335 [Flavobacteriales bacterium]
MIENCCTAYATAVNNVDNYGFSIKSEIRSKIIHKVVGRPISKESEAAFHDMLMETKPDYRISSEFSIGISYCPWCGIKLKE